MTAGKMSKIPDVGDWGNGSDDPYTPPEEMRRFYFAFNADRTTFFGTGRAPKTWTKKRIAEHGLFRYANDLAISFDVRFLKPYVEPKPMKKRFLVTFSAVRKGALGVRSLVTKHVEAESPESARLSLYDDYEHITILQMSEVSE